MLLTVSAALVSLEAGATVGLGLVLALAAFLSLLTGFIVAPHLTIALTIPFFSFLPAAKILVTAQLAPTKDVVIGAAVVAATVLALERRTLRRGWLADRPLLLLITLFIGLYIVDVGGALTGEGGHNLAWVHGVRLASEPFLLLVAGLSLTQPRRTLRWAVASLILTACGVALVGLAQQVLGDARLVSYGYAYGAQVRTIGTHLRSFGTLDEPFSYAGLLLLGLTGALFWMRRGLLAYSASCLLLLGLAASLVRSAAVIVVALVGLWLARQRHTAPAVFLVVAAMAGAVVFLVGSGASETRTVAGRPSQFLTVNGRTDAWKVALGGSTSWPFGRGVGVVGTAAERATGVERTAVRKRQTQAVDSGYFAAIADVGIVGLVLLLLLFVRLLVLGRRATKRYPHAGWLTLGLLTVMLLDAVTRASFTGYPTAHIGLLVVGLALAAALEAEERWGAPVETTPASAVPPSHRRYPRALSS